MPWSITQALWNLERAGAERVVVDLAVESQKRGHNIRILTASGGGPLEEELTRAGIPYELGPVTGDRLKTRAFFIEALTRNRPDIFHTHLGADQWGGLASRSLNISPWLATVHNDDRDDPLLRHALRGYMYRRADHVVCISHAVKKYVEREFRVRPDKLSIIRNGIDLRSLKQRPSQEFADVPRILCIGRLCQQKGQDILLKALAKISRPWKLDLLGEGLDRLVLERLAESLGIAPRVTFAGSVADVRTRLAKADLVCIPSRWEGQSLALLEAVGSNVPVLVQDLPIFHESFDEGMLSYVPSLKPEAWTRALEEVLQGPSNALLRAYHAEERVRESFGRARMAEEYLACYEKLLQKKVPKKNTI